MFEKRNEMARLRCSSVRLSGSSGLSEPVPYLVAENFVVEFSMA